MNPTDAETLMLLAAHMLALVVAGVIFAGMIFLHRRNRVLPPSAPDQTVSFYAESPQRPASWLAVRSAGPEAVRAALPPEDDFFVSERVNGWVIVISPALPNPSEDVDKCFHFLTALSRKLGHIQFFYAEKFSSHHAWARMDDGCVTRAYAWAGETIWTQGAKTMMEIELGLKCFNYGEGFPAEFWALHENVSANVEKIPLLAARWSIDPAILHQADKSSRLS